MVSYEIVKMMANFIEGKMSAEEFSSTFPEFLIEQWEKIEQENQQLVYLLNEDMPDICANYEPDPLARSQYPEYSDEEQFKQQVNQVYQSALKLLN